MAGRIGPLTVYVTNEAGVVTELLPGDSVPVWATVCPEALASDDSTPPRIAAMAAPAASASAPSGDAPPPISGAGSSREHWAVYAEASGVTVAPAWKRDQIIEACRAAGLRVE